MEINSNSSEIAAGTATIALGLALAGSASSWFLALVGAGAIVLIRSLVRATRSS